MLTLVNRYDPHSGLAAKDIEIQDEFVCDLANVITINSFSALVLVRQVSSIFQPNCAFCEERNKFGTLVEYHVMNRFGYWIISNSASDGCGSHFSKWPTAVTVMMHICLTGEECRLTVKYYLLMKVQ